MSFKYLQERKHYEDRYDNSTIEECRMGERIVNKSFTQLVAKLPAKELKKHRAGWYLEYSTIYFMFVEYPAAARAANREAGIAAMMKQDEVKDQRLEGAKFDSDKYCLTCGKPMQVISKDYMHRDGHKEDDILLMVECTGCNKRRAFWQDGTEWEKPKREIKCTKCGSVMESSSKEKGKVLTITETCASCGHVETSVMDFTKSYKEEEPVDPYYEVDRKRFLFGENMMSKFEAKARHFDRLIKLGADVADREEHVDVYEAIKTIKKLKIAQLHELLTSSLTGKKFCEFKLGEPQLAREVTIGFSCLDQEASREEYQSKKDLHKLIDEKLLDTNWHLVAEGISYRLGYLLGRLRAYESEEDLKKLVEKRIKDGALVLPKNQAKSEPKTTPHHYEGMRMREAAQVYMHNLTLGQIPAEITLKSGKIKKTGLSVISGEINPLFKVVIPFRDDDDSVPELIRNFDFKLGPDKDEIPKVSKDDLGREIRLI